MNPKNFFGELKRRNVYKVAVAYLVGSWLLIQAASIFLPAFDAPAWGLKVMIVLLVFGFPVALILSWAFEITPEGIRLESEVTPNESVTRRTGRKIVGVTIAVALLAAGLFVFQILRPRLTTAENPVVETAAIPEKSIAVLPFENLSDNKENAYFTDGVQDEILTDLAKVADLKVISRTSVMQYRDAATRNLRKIGEELGVAHLLEGSVQRADGKVRVNAQLIDARTDAHLWAQTYDRDLKDVFAIQSEIAQTIAGQLQAKLSPNEQKAIAQPPTTDLVAYDLYQRARALDDEVNESNSKESLLQAIALLDEAVRRDPKFLLAYCLLVEVHTDLFWGGFDPTPARLELAKAALAKAENLAPDAGEVHFEKGTYLYHGLRDYTGARAEFEIAQRKLPNFARVHLLLGAIDRRQARWDDARKNFQQAVRIGPRDFFVLEETGLTFGGLRQFDEARNYLARATALNPKDLFAKSILWEVPFLEKGELGSWRAHLDEALRKGNATAISISFVDCALAERNRTAADEALTLIPPEGTVDSTNDVAWPRSWYVGLVEKSFGETAPAQAAFSTARIAAEEQTRAQPTYAAGWMILGLIDAGLGRKSDAITEGKRACELLPLAKDAWDGPTYVTSLALIYTWVGEKDLALEQLALSARIPAGVYYGNLKLDPQWDALRGDPRFEKILASLAPQKRIGQPLDAY
jgi:TolB-like protein/cytochrome c-type biogenesis protein CcmH/NrfG